MAWQREKTYEIVDQSTKRIAQVEVDGRPVRLGKNGIGLTKDKALAQQIEARYGDRGTGDLLVIETDDDAYKPRRINPRFHTVPDMSRFKKSKDDE